MPSRQLTVLNINDNTAHYLHKETVGDFVTVHNVGSYLDVQTLLRTRELAVDIYLIDVNMKIDTAHSHDIEWGHSFPPYGPLLALPFLSTERVAAFVPYSNFWLSPGLRTHGFFLLALSFIFSQVKGCSVSTDTVRET